MLPDLPPLAEEQWFPPIRCARCGRLVESTAWELDVAADCWRIAVSCHGKREDMALPWSIMTDGPPRFVGGGVAFAAPAVDGPREA